jgi:MFS family permease
MRLALCRTRDVGFVLATRAHADTLTALHMNDANTTEAPLAREPRDARSLRDISPSQWKSGIAAWLGWLFDGLDMHIYTLVATAFVAILLNASTFRSEFSKLDANNSGRIEAAEWAATEPLAQLDHNKDAVISPEEYEVFAARSHTGNAATRQKSSWIQAAFLIGWALGGGFFGRLGDVLGRTRALSLTVLTYALFTGLSFFAQEWWHLLIFRFLAALGIGGEWAVGSTLLAETWPKKWRPWTAAVLQTGVNIGVVIACFAGILLQGQHPRWIFLIGVIPAVLVFWIRRHVPEPETWSAAAATSEKPRVIHLFRGATRRVTLVSILICALTLTGWWAFMFWQAQHVRNLDAVKAMSASERDSLVSVTFALIIGISIIGNFVAGGLARWLGYKRALMMMFGGFFVTFLATFGPEHSLHALTRFWLPAVGFWSGVFGLFTMLLPPLFPTLLRTTGAGFSYNIGRIAAAIGTVFAAQITQGGNFRQTLFYTGFLFLIAIPCVALLPNERDQRSTVGPPLD